VTSTTNQTPYFLQTSAASAISFSGIETPVGLPGIQIYYPRGKN